MSNEREALLQRGREIIAVIDTQLMRMGRILELQTGERPVVNVEEQTRLKSLLRSLTEWSRAARALGIDPEKEFAKDLPKIHSAASVAQKPTLKDPLLNAFLAGDLRDDGPKPPKKKASQMPLENFPP